MEGSGWRSAQGDPGMASGDWRSELSTESRQRIVNKIMDTLKKHLPISGPEGLSELNKIAVRLEEKIYAAATSKPDYVRKITLKLLPMESKSSNTNPLATNSAAGIQNSQDPAVQQPKNLKRSCSYVMGKEKKCRMSCAVEEENLCAICLDPVMDNGDRSTAKLRCSHQFHLDCIGSAFNAKASMQCPTCRRVENGQWRFCR